MMPPGVVSPPPPRRPWLLLTAALLALVQIPVGFFLPPARPGPREYPLLVARGGLANYPGHAGFGENAVYPVTPPATDFPGVECFGSWLGSDAGTGQLVSPWFRPEGSFELLVAGYPSTGGNSVALEIRRPGAAADLAVERRPLTFADAHEQWTLQRVRLPDAAAPDVEVRLVATDAATGAAGWLGVSAPFREGRHTLLWSVGELGRLALALGAVVTAVVGVGLALRGRVGGKPAALAFVPLPGVGWLVGTALVAWRLAPGVDPRGVAAVALTPLFAWTAFVFAQTRGTALVTPAEGRVLALAGCVLLLAVGKAQFSAGPAGELYGESVSRTLEVGGRSDARVAFHVVQLVAHGTSPFSPRGAGYFAPWGFTSRGPLLGLASAALVLGSGAHPPTAMPEARWQPLDPEGFAVYRLAMMALGAAALLPLWSAARALLGDDDRAGLLAVALAAGAPFVVHEVYFTWGKLATAGSLAAAVYALTQRRFATAGALVAVGYLCHPLVLLYVPFLGIGTLWLALRDNGRRGPLPALLAAGVKFGLPVLGALAFWRWVGRGDQELNYGQGFFLNYLFAPTTREAFDFTVWGHHRLESTLNTLVTGWLFFVNASHPEVNALHARSPRLIHWFFQYWNTLPFGLGLLGLPVFGAWLWRVARARPGVFALTAVGPFVLFAVYWGAAPTGLMREGLHPWVLALCVLAAAGATSAPGGWSTVNGAAPFLLVGRGIEIGLMCFLTTLVTSPALPRPAYLWLDAAMLGLSWPASPC